MTDDAQPTWQYVYDIIENSELNKRLPHVLNWRGSEGWELVSLGPRMDAVLGGAQGGDLIAAFKRPGVGAFDPSLADLPAY
jgi:hypothetical protein